MADQVQQNKAEALKSMLNKTSEAQGKKSVEPDYRPEIWY
jgi:hypothetical protein